MTQRNLHGESYPHVSIEEHRPRDDILLQRSIPFVRCPATVQRYSCSQVIRLLLLEPSQIGCVIAGTATHPPNYLFGSVIEVISHCRLPRLDRTTLYKSLRLLCCSRHPVDETEPSVDQTLSMAVEQDSYFSWSAFVARWLLAASARCSPISDWMSGDGSRSVKGFAHKGVSGRASSCVLSGKQA